MDWFIKKVLSTVWNDKVPSADSFYVHNRVTPLQKSLPSLSRIFKTGLYQEDDAMW
jgi:hypothetical protein